VAAQKLGLASSIGTLSLLLRKAGETDSERSLRVTLKDLFSDMIPETGRTTTTTITVRKGDKIKEDHSVPIEGGSKRRAANTPDGRPAVQ